MESGSSSNISEDPRVVECVTLIRGFVGTVCDHVEQTTGRRIPQGTVTRAADQLGQAVSERIQAVVDHHVARAFQKIVDEHPNGASVAYSLRYPQRTRHLLRLLTCSFSDLVARDDGSRSVHSKVILGAMENWVRKVLGNDLFWEANARALEVLGRIGLDDDAEDDGVLWQRLHEDADCQLIYYGIAIPLLIHFRINFDGSRLDMQRAIGTHSGNVIQLNAEQWNVLFHRLFSPLIRRLSDPAQRDRIDALFDPGTSVEAARVIADYRKWLKANRLSEPG